MHSRTLHLSGPDNIVLFIKTGLQFYQHGYLFAAFARGNERASWQSQGLDPLAAAAILWARTHVVAAAVPLASNGDRKAGINEKGQKGADAAPGLQHQTDEMKPIRRPEAE